MRLKAYLTYGILSGFCFYLTGCGSLNGYHGNVQCVPYARYWSGIMLYGRAAEWWAQAKNQYSRTHSPSVGSILVLRSSPQMPDGHVAYVHRVVNKREIRVDQANWVPGSVEYNIPVEDISSAGNWSLVRVWWSPSNRMGRRANAAYGFISSVR